MEGLSSMLRYPNVRNPPNVINYQSHLWQYDENRLSKVLDSKYFELVIQTRRWGAYVWIVAHVSWIVSTCSYEPSKWTCAEKLMPRTNGSRTRLKNKASQRANFLFCGILLFHLIFSQINLKLYDIAPPAMILNIWTILTTACVCPEPAASCNNVRLSKEALGSTTRSNSSNTFTWAKMLMHFIFASFAHVYILCSALKCI